MQLRELQSNLRKLRGRVRELQGNLQKMLTKVRKVQLCLELHQFFQKKAI